MMLNVAFYGHTWERRFVLVENNTYKEYQSPGGAALAATLAGYGNCLKQPIDCKREYIQLQRSGNICFPTGKTGWTDGNCLLQSSGGDAAVIWDEGFGKIVLPRSIPVLWASNRVLPPEHDVETMRGRGLVLLDVDVLRRKGAMISKQVSWERSATDIVWQLMNNPTISYLNRLDNIIIVFAEDGAVHLYMEDGIRKAKLVLTNGSAEGTLRGKHHSVPDAWAGMVAVCALQFTSLISGDKKIPIVSLLTQAEHHIKTDYNISALESGEIPIVSNSSGAEDISYDIPIYDSCEGADPHYWRIGGNTAGHRIFDIAFDYVKNGADAVKSLPHISFGGLTTVDRLEIEAFSNIKNLIIEYVTSQSSRPLSIVVFGAPGSGKSFGITQIAKYVLPGLIEKLEFNVSQFTGANDLTAAFHRVRDVILGGKLPLVFFDEFDSDRDGRSLGWLKGFLMPMQDGKFKDTTGEHPVGRCIFVFAGGTSPTFEAFKAPLLSDNDEIVREFRNVKGPDFISRLRGIVDVLGPNKASVDDNNYILRRAILLRSLCEGKLTMLGRSMPVNDNVLKAMLLVPKYKHGARSMEAILDMSRIEGVSWEPASLPIYTQLSLHVDADAFIRLVLGEVRLNSFTEKLAHAIHDDFVRKNSTTSSQSFIQPWEELDEEIRESNRRQARSIPMKLSAIGYSCDAGDTPFPSVDQFEDDEILALAMKEHEQWMEEKIADGWVHGTTRDNDRKIHSDLVPWEKLSPAEKQKDIDTAGNIILLLKSAGLRVYKMV